MLAAASISHSRLSRGGESSPGGPAGGDGLVPRGEQVGAGAGVEQQGGLGAPRALLEPDHELAGAGGRPPVHLPQVVAVPVLAGADVVLAVDGDRPAGALAAAAVPTGGTPGAELSHPGDDEQRRGVAADRAALDQPEGVDQPQPQRPEQVAAAAVAVHAVAQHRRVAAGQPVDHEPRRAAQVGRAAAR